MVQKFITAMLLFVSVATFSQNNTQTITQTVRGNVSDKESKAPLAFASVIMLGSSPIIGTATDSLGNFALPNISQN